MDKLEYIVIKVLFEMSLEVFMKYKVYLKKVGRGKFFMDVGIDPCVYPPIGQTHRRVLN